PVRQLGRCLPMQLGSQRHVERLIWLAVAGAAHTLRQVPLEQCIFAVGFEREPFARLVAIDPGAPLAFMGPIRTVIGLTARAGCRSTFGWATARAAGGCSSRACSSAARRSLPRRMWLLTVFSGISSTSAISLYFISSK